MHRRWNPELFPSPKNALRASAEGLARERAGRPSLPGRGVVLGIPAIPAAGARRACSRVQVPVRPPRWGSRQLSTPALPCLELMGTVGEIVLGGKSFSRGAFSLPRCPGVHPDFKASARDFLRGPLIQDPSRGRANPRGVWVRFVFSSWKKSQGVRPGAAARGPWPLGFQART